MESGSDRPFRSTLLSLCALSLCVFLWSAVVTFNAGDWPSPNQYPHNAPPVNACGVVGAWLAYQFHYWIGDGSYPLLLFATMVSLVRLIRGRIGNKWEQVLGVVLLVACTSASVHLISTPSSSALPVGHGGVIGFALGTVLRRSLDQLGTVIVLAASLVVGLTFVTQGWVLRLPSALGHIARRRSDHPGRLTAELIDNRRVSRVVVRSQTRRRPIPAIESVHMDENPSLIEDADVRDASDVSGNRKEGHLARKKAKSKKARKGSADPIVNVPTAQPARPRQPYPRQIENWRLPPLELLHEPEYGFDAQQEQVVRKHAKILEQTLADFRINARVVEIDTGPVITMFELKLGAGIKVSQIATLSNDIARALKAPGIRVVAPISGKNTIGIEVPNVEKEKVRLRELLMLAGKKASEMQLPLFLGKDAGGAALVADVTRMPHLLIAGTTGSGKSVSLNAVILSMLMTKRPDRVKLILIDPKMVELSHFKDVPHLMCPIVSDMARAQKILEWAVTKMDERYALLSEARVRNIEGYNQLGSEELFVRLAADSKQEQAAIAKQLPYIVIIIDELADLMMTSAKEVEHHLSRLAQKSRAVGIHLIVATQRPEAKVITGLIKSNLPSRISFRVASRMDSRIVLDQNGAEVLLGQGDMLFLPPGSHKLIRAQGTFLEEEEIHAVLAELASRAKPEYHPELLRSKRAGDDTGGGTRDPLFNKAVLMVLESQRGSASLLQRRLTIGYSRASRLIEQMAEAGIVGGYNGSQARQVTLTLEQWESLHAKPDSDRVHEDQTDPDAGSAVTTSSDPGWQHIGPQQGGDLTGP